MPSQATMRWRVQPRPCQSCGVPFKPSASNDRKGYGHYCSRACYTVRQKEDRRPLADRFWEKVNTDGPIPTHRPELGPCWPWTGSLTPAGYGHLQRGGRDEGTVNAPTVAWELTYGPIPDDHFICHHCDNPPCCRPEHLFIDTPAGNVRDMVAKDRHARGERAHGAKLTDAAVLAIRERWHRENITQRALATEYGVSIGTISMLIAGKTWKHLTGST